MANAVDCPQAHGLKKVTIPEPGRVCDLCDDRLEPGSDSFACEKCGFDVCDPCMEPHGQRRRQRLLDKVLKYVDQAQSYIDANKQALARDVLPKALLSRASDGSEARDLLIDLLRWFKKDFFQWTDSPFCQTCSMKTTKNEGFVEPFDDDLLYGANRVESWRCTGCESLLRFPRYNDPAHLLETRHGRCGEWANCFTLILAAMGFNTRLVIDWTDHVWSEVRFDDSWHHCDPCEASLDAPLMYECGWGKKLSYIIAFSAQEVVDVSPRYTQNWPQLLSRRQLLSEDALEELISCHDLLSRSKSGLETPSWQSEEKAELLSLRVKRDGQRSAAELGGRTSGSMEWRRERGECGIFHPVVEESDSILFMAEFNDRVVSSQAQLLAGALIGEIGTRKCFDLRAQLAALEMADLKYEDAFLSDHGFTVEAWVHVKSEDLREDAFMNPVMSRHGPASGWELRLCRKGGIVFLITIDGVHIELMTVGRPWLDQWVHVAGTFDGQRLCAYIAKELVGEMEVPAGTKSSFSGSLCLGCNPAWTDRSVCLCVHSARLTSRVFDTNSFLPGPKPDGASFL